MKVTTLHRLTVASIMSSLRDLTDARGLLNVFNPSVVVRADATFVAFRAEGEVGERPFKAYLATFDSNGVVDLIDLSAVAKRHGIHKTADPKLVTLHGEVYVTFNTGNVHSGTNDIYLQSVTPTLGSPQRCVLANRRMVEKNWGFYTLSGRELQAIYSLAPLTVLRLETGELGTTDSLTFTREAETEMPSRFPRLHIGSQPLIITATKAIVAANQQVPVPGLPRKFYFGRLAELDLQSGRLTRLSSRALVHSLSSTLPQRRPHNPGLLSATYFAGLTLLGDSLLVSYGVNDKTFGIATLDEDQVWR